MIELLTKELQEVLEIPCYYEEQKMNNYLAQNQKDENICYVEEYRNGSYEETYGLYRVSNIALYFYEAGNGRPLTAEEREAKRNILEGYIIKMIKHFGDRMSDIRFNIGPSRYNSIETGISITLTYREEIC